MRLKILTIFAGYVYCILIEILEGGFLQNTFNSRDTAVFIQNRCALFVQGHAKTKNKNKIFKCNIDS